MRTVIGLDVGYSKNKASCGIATNSDILPPSWSPKTLMSIDGKKHVSCARARLADAVNWLAQSRDSQRLADALLVLDGPVASGGPPRPQNRWVDQQCQKGVFQNRCVAAPLNGGGGQTFVVATYLLSFAATGSLGGPSYRTIPSVLPGYTPAQVFETNPTVGLGMLLNPVVLDVLPSRNGGSRLHPGGESCSAKSDWYWADGAGERVAEIIGIPDLAFVTDHEERAGLYCLAVGLQIAEGTAEYIGDPGSGVYCLAGPLHPGWVHAALAARRGCSTTSTTGAVALEPACAATGAECLKPECLLHAYPVGVKRCPFCGWVKPDQRSWGGIDGHFNHKCPSRPEGMLFEDFKARICRGHWPR